MGQEKSRDREIIVRHRCVKDCPSRELWAGLEIRIRSPAEEVFRDPNPIVVDCQMERRHPLTVPCMQDVMRRSCWRDLPMGFFLRSVLLLLLLLEQQDMGGLDTA